MGILGPGSARLIRIALITTGIIVVARVVPPWLRATIPARHFRLAGGMLLLAAQPAYGAALVLLTTGLVASSRRVIRARRRGESRPMAARMVLLCSSTLLSIVAAEATVGAFRVHRHRHPALDVPPIRSGDRDGRELNMVVIGGSSACGLPFETRLSTGHIVAWKLGEALPDRRVRLDVLAEPGVHLERMHQKLADYRRRIDLLIVYSGHNEFTYRYHWTRSAWHYLDEIPGLPLRWIKGMGRRYSPICAMAQEALEAQGLGDAGPPDLLRRPVDVPICAPEEYAARLADFGGRLEEIVGHCERVGTPVVVLVPPSNDSGFEPNRSILPPWASREDRAAFAERLLAAVAIEEVDPSRAITAYRRMLEDHPGFAETHFRLARLLERSGAAGEARAHYRAARDLDALPMRCTSDFEAACREVAARHPGAILVDGPAAMAAETPGGILGDRFFLDAMHPTVRGHAILARAILDALRERRVLWPEGTPGPRIDPAGCAAHFGIGPEAWRIACEWGATFYERTAPIRYDPSTRLAWIDRYRRAARAIAGGTDPEAVGLPAIGVRSGPASFDRLRVATVRGPAPGGDGP